MSGPVAGLPAFEFPVYELATDREVGLCAALAVIDEARRAIARRGRCVIAVPGGTTPLPMFSGLAALSAEQRFDWTGATIVWVDERRVPYSSPDSNFGSAMQHGLGSLAGARILGMPVAGDAEQGALAYERSLREVLRTLAGRPAPLDLVVLGVGADGHVASLFPDAATLAAERRWVVPATAPSGVRERLTLTLPLLRAARRRVILATGAAKRDVVARVLGRTGDADGLPVRLVVDGGPTAWLLDRAAAGSPPPLDWSST